MKMNDIKPSKFQFHFPGLLVAKEMKKNVPMAIGDNPTYPITDPEGQEGEV